MSTGAWNKAQPTITKHTQFTPSSTMAPAYKFTVKNATIQKPLHDGTIATAATTALLI